jgi:hypothetical protein
MNTRAMVARLNELDDQLYSACGISRSGDATTLDEASMMAAATTERLLTRQRCVGDDSASPIERGALTDFLQAQLEARQLICCRYQVRRSDNDGGRVIVMLRRKSRRQTTGAHEAPTLSSRDSRVSAETGVYRNTTNPHSRPFYERSDHWTPAPPRLCNRPYVWSNGQAIRGGLTCTLIDKPALDREIAAMSALRYDASILLVDKAIESRYCQSGSMHTPRRVVH